MRDRFYFGKYILKKFLLLTLKTTSLQSIQHNLFSSGRAKLKKKIFPILMLVGLKLFAVIPIILGVIGLVAAKALIVGKLALIIAAVIAFQKFVSGSGSSGFGSYKLPVSTLFLLWYRKVWKRDIEICFKVVRKVLRENFVYEKVINWYKDSYTLPIGQNFLIQNSSIIWIIPKYIIRILSLIWEKPNVDLHCCKSQQNVRTLFAITQNKQLRTSVVKTYWSLIRNQWKSCY